MTNQLLESVQSKYAAVAKSTLSNKDGGVKAVAEAFGYSPGRTLFDTRRSKHGPFLWQSYGDCFNSIGRSDCRSWLGWGVGRIPGVSTGGAEWSRYWD